MLDTRSVGDDGRPLKSSYGRRGPGLIALSWTFFAIGVVVVGLRTYTTLFIVKRPKWDLYFTLIATALAISSQPLIVLASYKGVGNAVQNVNPLDMQDMLFWQWCYYVPVIFSTIFSKLAVATLILEIQDRTFPVMRYLLYFVMALSVLLGTVIASTIFAQCDPVSDLWRTDSNTNPRCKLVNLTLVGGTIQGSFSSFTDIFLAVYPVIIFWRLNMSWRRRLGICVLFCGGLVSGIGAILKTIFILGLKTSADPTNAIADLMTWAHVEVWIIIYMSTLPPLRPLFVRVFKVVSTHTSSLSHSGRKGKTSNSSAGFHELSKGTSGEQLPRHVEQEPDGSLELSGTRAKSRDPDAWMDAPSSEEDILAGTLIGHPALIQGGFYEPTSDLENQMRLSHLVKEDDRQQEQQQQQRRRQQQSVVVSAGSKNLGLTGLRPAATRDPNAIRVRVDRDFVIETMDRQAGTPDGTVGGDKWRQTLAR